MTAAAGRVLDSSALLAYLRDESGSQLVDAALAVGAHVNAVNWAEVLSRIVEESGRDAAEVELDLWNQGLLGGLLSIVPFREADAISVARLRPLTRSHELLLGDRACLATAMSMGLPVLTADRAWAEIDFGMDIQLIR